MVVEELVVIVREFCESEAMVATVVAYRSPISSRTSFNRMHRKPFGGSAACGYA